MLSRSQLVDKIKDYLIRKSHPKIHMGLIILFTAIFGFFISSLLLFCNLNIMWLRYGLAVLSAYAFFLLLIALWLKSRQRQMKLDLDSADLLEWVFNKKVNVSETIRSPNFTGGGGEFGSAGADASFDTPGSSTVDSSSFINGIDIDFDLDALKIIGIIAIIVLVFACLAASIYVVFISPTLFAELILDSAICAGLYHRLKMKKDRHWQETVVKKTWKPFLVVMFFFIVTGIILQKLFPAAISIGDIFQIFID